MKLCGEAWLNTGDPWVPEHDIGACMSMTCSCLDAVPGLDDLDDVVVHEPLREAGAA